MDVAFVGSAYSVNLHTGPDLYDLAVTVQPGNTYNFSVSMFAPFGTGPYGELWRIQQGSSVLCQFWIYINVP